MQDEIRIESILLNRWYVTSDIASSWLPIITLCENACLPKSSYALILNLSHDLNRLSRLPRGLTLETPRNDQQLCYWKLDLMMENVGGYVWASVEVQIWPKANIVLATSIWSCNFKWLKSVWVLVCFPVAIYIYVMSWYRQKALGIMIRYGERGKLTVIWKSLQRKPRNSLSFRSKKLWKNWTRTRISQG